MRPEDLTWLRDLNDEIVDKDTHAYARPAKRRLTDEELDRVIGMVVRHQLPAVMFNLNTSIGCAIYEHPSAPAYPGIAPEHLRPPLLLWLCAAHLPLSEARKMPDRTIWDDGWRVFSKLTHTEANKELCLSCGLERPREPGHYAY